MSAEAAHPPCEIACLIEFCVVCVSPPYTPIKLCFKHVLTYSNTYHALRHSSCFRKAYLASNAVLVRHQKQRAAVGDCPPHPHPILSSAAAVSTRVVLNPAHHCQIPSNTTSPATTRLDCTVSPHPSPSFAIHGLACEGQAASCTISVFGQGVDVFAVLSASAVHFCCRAGRQYNPPVHRPAASHLQAKSPTHLLWSAALLFIQHPPPGPALILPRSGVTCV